MKRVKITLDNKDYDLVLDLRGALLFQELQGETIFEGVDKIANKQDMTAIINLLCSTVRNKKGEPIKKEVILGLDMIENLPAIMVALNDLLVKDKEDIKG